MASVPDLRASPDRADPVVRRPVFVTISRGGCWARLPARTMRDAGGAPRTFGHSQALIKRVRSVTPQDAVIGSKQDERHAWEIRSLCASRTHL